MWQIDIFKIKVGFFYGTAISPTLLQNKELIGKVETKFSPIVALVVSDRKKKTNPNLFRQLKEYSNDNYMTYLKVRLIDVRVKIVPLCYYSL